MGLGCQAKLLSTIPLFFIFSVRLILLVSMSIETTLYEEDTLLEGLGEHEIVEDGCDEVTHEDFDI